MDIMGKSIKPQSFSFICPIYEHLIEVIIGVEELKRLTKVYPSHIGIQVLAENCLGEDNASGYHLGYSINSAHTILYFDINDSFFGFMRVYAHEIRHAVDSILIPRGFNFIPNTANEAFSYLQGYLSEVILEKIKYS